jgi:hypothetical protein
MKKDLFKNRKANINNEKKYSSIQYFFWLLSGCEINILKDCPTDYNRQAGIGFTIFMTTILAFFSGSYAGWYFGKSYSTAIVFGLLWSALIFSIDRSMVVTLKKDPTKKKQSFWAPLISRGIMALLIAFIISIPLELLIFQENIELHMVRYDQDQTQNVKDAQIRNEDIANKSFDLQSLTNDSEKIQEQLNPGEPIDDLEYDKLKSDYNQKNDQFVSILSAFKKANSESIIALNNVPTYYTTTNKIEKDKGSSQWKKYEKKIGIRNSAKNKLNNFDKNGLNKSKKDLENYKNNWITQLKTDKIEIDNNIKAKKKSISKSKKIVDSLGTDFGKKINEKKGFVKRFMVLEDLASSTTKIKTKDSKGKTIEKTISNEQGATILFLLWLIRILFFTIEILPTIAKIATPLGAYDFAIYRKEREIEEDLEKRTEDYLTHQKNIREKENIAHLEQVDTKNKIENELHTDLLKQIASAQNEVAKKQIEEFRNKHLI